ncbi:REP-associated tyrosine transposase [Desulfofundulus sp.]|uniref:REP-associated tyrosine transposase n=1 Tax=Desulfofundulus sp. TaxID=2282750 RepID=UPI003C721FC1
MGRSPRIEFEGAMYHVIQRGNNREFIFFTSHYKEYLLEQLRFAIKVDGLDVFAYVIMNNHFHLAVRTNRAPLSKVMHRLNSRFSRYYNRDQGRTGHVFESRYKAVPIQNERYLLAVIRYIHRNPVRAGLCDGVADYQWSSDADYRGEGGGFVCTQQLLDILDDDPGRALKKYVILMETDDERVLENVSISRPESFASKVEPGKNVPARKHLDEILMASGVNMEEFAQIKSGSRKRSLVPYKVWYAGEALAQGYTLQEIGENIRISAVAVYKLLVPGT